MKLRGAAAVAIRRALLMYVLVAAAGCGHDTITTSPIPNVKRIVAVAGDSLTGKVGEPHTTLQVRAEDAAGEPVANVRIRFFIPIGSNGSLDTTPVFTDANGIATSRIWVLGTQSGVQVARAHAPAVATVFTAFAEPDAPSDIVAIAGNRQVALAGTSTRVPPAVRVIDRFGNGVPGMPVTFASLDGGSSVVGSSIVTDSAGEASAASWTLLSGTATVAATSEAVPSRSAVFEARVVSRVFGIDVRAPLAPLPTRLAVALERAAARWSAVFPGSAGTSAIQLDAGRCGGASPAMNELVTDAVILVRVAAVDGRDNILASAAPCASHETTSLPAVARITFDEADLDRYIAQGWVDVIALHEMGHALGFGTTWDNRLLLQGAGSGDPIFTGSNARREFATFFGGFGGRVVPVENMGGPGTADRHWRASVFLNEVMNGFVTSPDAPLSRITIGAMADIGYEVSYFAADPFVPVVLATRAPLQMRHGVRLR